MTQDTHALQSLIQQAVTTHQELVEKEQREAQEKKNREEKNAEQTLTDMLKTAFTPEFLEAISFQYRHIYQDSHTGKYYQGVRAYFTYANEHWNLNYTGDGSWHVYTTPPENHSYSSTTKLKNLKTEALQRRLLVEMAKRQEEVEKEAQIQREYKRASRERDIKLQKEQEENRLQWEEQQRKEAEELAIKKAAARGEHDRLMVKWQEAKQKALQEMWQWPEGLVLNIYYLQYQQGSYNNHEDETEVEFDYGYGWTTTCELDRGGWVTLQPIREYTYSEKETTPRSIKLNDRINFPIWEKHTITSIADLDDVLTHKVEFTVPGIAYTCDRLCENGEYRLIECDPDEGLGYREHWHTETLGRTPVKWIQDLADQAAKGK